MRQLLNRNKQMPVVQETVATDDDYRKLFLAILWTAYPRHIFHTTLKNICGGEIKANELIESLGDHICEETATVRNAKVRVYLLSDKAVNRYRRIL